MPANNWTGNIARFFVNNGQLSLLLVIALFIWGIMSFFGTPKQYNPKITAPAFQIMVDFPGASRVEVIEQVTKPLENIVSDIPNVEDIYSVSYNGGKSIVTVNFFVGENMDNARITLRDRIDSNFDRAPLGIATPLIRSIDPDDVPILTLGLIAKNQSPVAMRKLGFRLRDRLRTIPGASNIEVVGGRRRELSIRIDPERLARSGIGLMAIEESLARENIFLPAGSIKNPAGYIGVETHSNVRSPEDLRDLVIVTGDFGSTKLSEIASVREEISEVEDYVRHSSRTEDGSIQSQDSIVLLSIAKHSNANISDVTERVQESLDYLSRDFLPQGVHVEIFVDEGRVASEEISRLISNLFTAILIVVAILLMFLDKRAAFLVAISIPLTLAMVFGVGQLTGQNINRITLFALILSLGLLVDNATVVIENIVRWLGEFPDRKKLPLNDLIITAVSEVGPGLFMSTITTVLAFIPMAFVTGMMGPYMGPIPFFVPVALVISLLLSFSLNPYMASILLKSTNDGKPGRFKMPGLITLIIKILKAPGHKVFQTYKKLLHGLLMNPARGRMLLMGVLVALLASFTLPALKLVKFRLLPKADREQFFLYLDLPAGTPLEETNRVARAYETLLLKQPDIKMVQSFVGGPPILDFNGLFRGVSARQQKEQATLRVGMTHPDMRSEKSTNLVLDYRKKLKQAAAQIAPGKYVKLKLVEDPPGPPVLSTLLVRIQGHDSKLLEEIGKDIWPYVRNVDEVVDTDISIPDSSPVIQLVVDQARASRSRVNSAQIARILRTAIDGSTVGIYHNSDNIEQEYITLRLNRAQRQDRSILKKLFVMNELGIKIPLTDLVRYVDSTAISPARRENRRDTVYIYGDMGTRSITYSAIDLLYFLGDYKLPDGKGELIDWSLFGMHYRTTDGKEVEINLGGEWELTLDIFRDLGIAMGGAIFLIYFVLVAQFGSFKEPLVIMSTIPLSLIGVLPGFLVLGYTIGLYFNATSMIGVIALAGIAVNNSIILLEYLNGLRGSGLTLEEALVQAGLTRFRPIMLTTFTTMLGSLTIAGDPVWSGLAFAIIFGLGVSSVLTLLVFPLLYARLAGKDWQST